MSFVPGRSAAGVRHALPDRKPAAGLRHTPRYHSLNGILSAFPGGSPRTTLGSAPWASRQAAGRPGLVRKPEPQERFQSIDVSAADVAPSRCRCDVRQSAERPETRRQGVSRADRHHRSHDGAHRFQRDGGADRLPRSGYRPTWILLPWTPDYRWLLGRDDSPWYPTVRLFRQNETRDYAEVLERVRVELLALRAGT